MGESSTNRSSGIGFIGLLTIAFIALKLTNYIAWSWFWVLSPVLFSIVFVVFILVLALWAKSK